MTHDVTEVPDTDPKTAVLLAISGIIPIVAAIIILIIHLAHPVPDHHRGLVHAAIIILPMTSLALWLWCTACRIQRHFDRRYDAAAETAHRIDRRIDDLTNQLAIIDRSHQGLHKRIGAIDERISGIDEEIAHLRALAIESDLTTPGQRLGPRSLS